MGPSDTSQFSGLFAHWEPEVQALIHASIPYGPEILAHLLVVRGEAVTMGYTHREASSILCLGTYGAHR